MALFTARCRFTRQAAAFCVGMWFLFVGVAVPAATPVGSGAEYPHEIQQWIDEAGRDPVKAAAVVTVILEADPTTTVSSQVNVHGGKLRYRWGRLHEVSMPAGKLAALARLLPAGTVVRPPYPHVALAVTGQGVALTGAGDVQSLGNNGAGVKIGVIDMGFASYTAAQSTGDLPSNLTITDYTGTGTGGTDHGTNVAQIVYEMAPGAQLYLAKIATEVQLQQAMNDMAAAGVRVINHSVGWYAAAFYDGTGPICSITNQANTSNIQWVNAMGNDRNRHYMATFTDANSDLRHEFATGQNYNTISLTAGTSVSLVLNWDAYPTTSIDYNLYLYNGNPDAGGTVVAQSTTRQRGTAASAPYESITYTPSTSGTYYIVVNKYQSSTANTRFALFSLGPDLGVKTYSSSLIQPADCAYVLGVGATNLSDATEYFSADGPTTDGRAKPDVSGPNRVQTSLTSSFAGTSGASPHVAGAVALLRAQDPSKTTLQIRNLLISTVKDVNTVGFDYRTGYGRISLDADGDGYNHDADNCRLVSNQTQADLDGDSIGDACDGDIDGDGLSNTQEAALGIDPMKADTDGDGLTDGAEVNTYGTNPLLADTDGDGLADGFEVNTRGTNPLLADTDGDGLADGFEVNTYGTNPLLADTDGDGLADGFEINTYGTNPLLADTDGDGLADGFEVNTRGTNPLLADTDGDGLADGFEVNTYGTNPLLADTDSDGLADGLEVNVYGTNPLQADTDGDGLTDGFEANTYGTSPTVSNKGDLAPSGVPNGQVDVSDLMMLMRFVEHLQTPAASDLILGDMNGDGVLDIRDVLMLRRQLGY